MAGPKPKKHGPLEWQIAFGETKRLCRWTRRGSQPSHVTGRGGTLGKIAVLASPVELPINRKWTSRYAKRKVIPDSESLRRGEHNAPISNTHRRQPYGNLGDRPLDGRYVRYGIETEVGVCT